MQGGELVAATLENHGVPYLFTLSGGHISPILVGAKKYGIRVIDTRDEVTAVFAADAVARLTGIPGVAAVTAGPGVTNAVTALKNAQMAQSPLVLFGGAAATVLKGRGALQDIDQAALLRSVVKWSKRVTRVRELGPAAAEAFRRAQSGVPGPVFVECPVDLLYGEDLVREMYEGQVANPRTLGQKAMRWYLRWHTNRLFRGADRAKPGWPRPPAVPRPSSGGVAKAASILETAERPVLVIGAQALLDVPSIPDLAAAIGKLGLPVYLTSMARGLLGRDHPLQMRHKRREALKEADTVILAGVPMDFRLDYGRQIRGGATLITANRSKRDLKQNRRPDLAVHGDPGAFLRALAEQAPEAGAARETWLESLRARDAEREAEIDEEGGADADGFLNPVALCREIEKRLPDDSVIVADGGDFVGTASYILRPRGPLRWLDPGPFGTLGVGAGFAIGAKLVNPEAEVWLIYGDGAAGYSLMEVDSCARHGLPVIGVIGNDAAWQQIAREQVKILGDAVGTELVRTDYHTVADGCGGRGFLLDDAANTVQMLMTAREAAAGGTPAIVNAHIGQTKFREGSISI